MGLGGDCTREEGGRVMDNDRSLEEACAILEQLTWNESLTLENIGEFRRTLWQDDAKRLEELGLATHSGMWKLTPLGRRVLKIWKTTENLKRRVQPLRS